MEGLASKLKFFKKNFQLYLMLLPGLVLLILFKYFPMYGLLISFKDFNPRRGVLGSDFIGFKHFENFFKVPDFNALMINTLVLSILSVVVGFIAPIILSFLINQIKYSRLKNTVQLIVYAPNFISMVIVCGMLFIVLGPVGPINSFLNGDIPFMTSNEWFRPVYIISNVWQSTGWGSIIYLAALSGVSPELVEAARLDGANLLQKIRYVDVPVIKPIAVIMLILSVGGIMSIGYEKAFLMQTSLNLKVSEILPTYLYKQGLQMGNYGYSTAIGLFNSVINLVLLISVNYIVKKFNEGEGL